MASVKESSPSLEAVIRPVTGLFLFIIFLIVGYPVLIILGVVLFVLRQILILIKRIIQPTYGDFVEGIASAFASEDPYGITETSIITHMIWDGKVDVEKFRYRVETKLKQMGEDGIYPELKQQLSSWAGFSLWIPELTFDIKTHVKTLTSADLVKFTGEDRVTDDNISHVSRKILSLPYTRGTSPWDIYICYDICSKTSSVDDATLIFFRFHHAMADALSVMKIIYGFIEVTHDGEDTKDMMEKGEIKLIKNSLTHKIVYGLTFPVLAAYDLAMLVARGTDFNSWHRLQTPARSNYNYVNLSLSSERIKRIRQLRQTSFFCVMCAAQVGAIRKFMDARHETIPNVMHAAVSVPIPSKKTRLSNDITFVALDFPTGENDRGNVIRKIDNSFASAKSSRYPLLVLVIFRVAGMVPRRIIAQFSWIFTTCGTTNFPASQTVISCLGFPCTFAGSVASLPSNIAMWSWGVGYNGTTSLAVGFSTDLVPDKASANKFLEYLQEEFEGLDNVKDNAILRPMPINFRLKHKAN